MGNKKRAGPGTEPGASALSIAGFLPQACQLIAQSAQRGGEVGNALLGLVDHRGRCLGHEGLVAELGVGLGQFTLQAGDFLGDAGLLGFDVDLHVQAHARLAHHGHGSGLGGGGPGGLVVEHLHFAELGQ